MSPASSAPLLVALGLGSNLPPADSSPFDLDPPSDPRARALEGALVLLRREGHALRAASALFETPPEGAGSERHGPFLNACVLVESATDLDELLEQCEAIERAAGRRSKGDSAPRPLDIDLLAAWREEGDRLVPLEPARGERLTLPHPRLPSRGFVLVPLVGVLPDAPIRLQDDSVRTAWELLRLLARSGAAGLKPGPRSASFPFRDEAWEISD